MDALFPSIQVTYIEILANNIHNLCFTIHRVFEEDYCMKIVDLFIAEEGNFEG